MSCLGCDVDVLRDAGHVPGREDPWVGGPLVLVDDDEAAPVSSNTCCIESQVGRVGEAPGRHEQPLARQPPLAPGPDLNAVVSRPHLRRALLHHGDALVLKHAEQHVCNLRLRVGREASDDGDGDTEVRPQLGLLEPDIPGAEHHHGCG